MNSFYALFVLAVVALGQIDPHEALPCAFEADIVTHLYSGGSELTQSIDAMYHDHDNLWRWDSDFKGIPGLFDAHEWSIIWRPDDGVSYHLFPLEGKCLKNNGASKMYPYPFDWLLSKTENVTWTKTDCKYQEEDAVKYSGTGYSSEFKCQATINLYVLKSGEFVHGDGSLEGSMIDITFEMTVSKFVMHSPLVPAIFLPSSLSPLCPSTTLPAPASKDFEKFCYENQRPSSSGAVVVQPSILFFFATLLLLLLISVAM